MNVKELQGRPLRQGMSLRSDHTSASESDFIFFRAAFIFANRPVIDFGRSPSRRNHCRLPVFVVEHFMCSLEFRKIPDLPSFMNETHLSNQDPIFSCKCASCDSIAKSAFRHYSP